MAGKGTDPRITAVRAKFNDSVHPLAESFMISLGVGMGEIMASLEAMAKLPKKYVELAVLCLVAGVQIRENANFVVINTVRDFPVFVITSPRATVSDLYNYSALHVAGHVLAAISTHKLASAINDKGNCVTGKNLTDSKSGKINSEIFKAWSETEKSMINNASTELKTMSNQVFEVIRAKHEDNLKSMTPGAPAGDEGGDTLI